MTASAGEDFVQSFARGLAVIRAFDADHPRLTLAEAARRAGLPRAAARRFLRTLEALGYVRGDGRSFALTPRVLELGFSYLSALSLPEVLQPHLEALSRDTGESSSAAVLDGTGVVYVARVPTRRIMSVRITLGTRFPAWVTSMGRVLLAGLDPAEAAAMLDASELTPLTERSLTSRDALDAEIARVRERGWALVEGELEPSLRAIAAPVRARDGAVVAAINVSMLATGLPRERVERELVPRLLEAAAAASADLRLTR